jgi:hypothetical protein
MLLFEWYRTMRRLERSSLQRPKRFIQQRLGGPLLLASSFG